MLARLVFQYAVARGVPGIASLLLLMAYTRLLTPQEYGTFAAALAAALLVKTVLFQWLELAVLRDLPAEATDVPDEVASTALGLFLLLAAGVLLTVSAFMAFGRATPGGPLLFAAAAGAVIGLAWFELQLAVMQKRMQPLRYGLLRTARAVFESAVGIGLVFAGLGAGAPMLGLLLGLAAASIAVPGLAWRKVPWRLDRSRAGGFLAYGLPLTAAIAASSVIHASDRLMLASMAGGEAVGLYSAAGEIAAHGIGLVMMVVNLAAYPIVLRAYEQGGRVAAEAQMSRNAQFMLAAALPVLFAVSVLATDLSAVFLGAAFHEGASKLLPLLALCAFLGGIRSFVFDLAFQVTKHTGAQARILIATAAANIVLNLMLIPSHGAMGAAWATLASYGMALALSMWHGRHLLRIRMPPAEALKIVVAALVPFGLLLGVAPSRGIGDLVLKLASSGVVYLALLFAFDVLGFRSSVQALRQRQPGRTQP